MLFFVKNYFSFSYFNFKDLIFIKNSNDWVFFLISDILTFHYILSILQNFERMIYAKRNFFEYLFHLYNNFFFKHKLPPYLPYRSFNFIKCICTPDMFTNTHQRNLSISSVYKNVIICLFII